MAVFRSEPYRDPFRELVCRVQDGSCSFHLQLD
jgi:hypothetical protein